MSNVLLVSRSFPLQDTILSIRHSIFADILLMEDNVAKLPESVHRCLR